MAKRLIDLLGSGLGLLLLAPLLLVVALAIKIDSPGPVFFRQTRVGRHGEEFRIHKLRTMRQADDAGAAPQITVGDDPRITRVGVLLRRTKLDELAQLIDVWRGCMSLVGPRPEVPRYVALYPPELRATLLGVRPGITDPASLAFRHESELLARAADPQREYVEVVMPAKLAISARYIGEASWLRDLQCIAATLRTLWTRQPPSSFKPLA